MNSEPHRIDFTITRFGNVQGKVTCIAPPGSFCRLVCPDGTCEEWAAPGECEHGPLTDQGRCTAVEWFDADGAEACYGGEDTPVKSGPIQITWEADGYKWVYR